MVFFFHLTSLGLRSLVPITIYMDLYILETSSILAKSIIKPRICIITVIYKMLEGMFKIFNYVHVDAVPLETGGKGFPWTWT